MADAARPPLAAVSVDLDEIHHYHRIHGLPAHTPTGPGAHAVYDVAMGRIADFARALAIPVDLFAVGDDLDRPESAAALARMVQAGHLVENHSRSHRYDLVRASTAEIAAEVVAGAHAIARVTGRRPLGFRAPGYTVSDGLFDALEDAGVRFDSSVFPCPSYWAAKAAVMASLRVRGRRSALILDTPRMLGAPIGPYRPGRPYWRRGQRGLVELPIQVDPFGRLPLIGTSIGLVGERAARMFARACVRLPMVNLELHGIDFLETADGIDDLRRLQPELARPLATRLAAFAAFVDELRRAGRTFVPLAEAASAFDD